MVSPAATTRRAQESGAPDSHHVRKAIIPLAGLATRLLPATKAVPKGMLPLIDKPVVQYIVEEANAAGLADIALITGRDEQAFETHFRYAPQLERLLAERGDQEALGELESTTGHARVCCLTQDEPRGVGDAVLRCADYVGTEPFAIMLGDNVLSQRGNLLARLIAARRMYGGTILALTEVSQQDVSSRVVVAFEPTSDPSVVRITDLVEKPSAADAPSNWIMIGRCICDPAIFGVLRKAAAGHGGEVQLSNALRALTTIGADNGGGVHGLFLHGRRLDTGNKQDYIRAMVEVACARKDIAGEFVPWLRRYVAGLG